eukprot:TRINITY_DN5206_c0_g1_i1.p1 TRINITY_DN5206_c0_g1~~TRINITY_DN5206_c0_g1_i1.p1  ORF type:complete len:396 (-),score=13.39 TRINITY_DN5206_c0_g1_i1:167-1354(-)
MLARTRLFAFLVVAVALACFYAVHVRLYYEIQSHQNRPYKPKNQQIHANPDSRQEINQDAQPDQNTSKGDNEDEIEEPLPVAPAPFNSTAWLLKHVRITILTSAAKNYQREKVWRQLKSWIPSFESIITVISDSDDSGTGNDMVVPGFVNSMKTKYQCDNTYQRGLWCKNRLMINLWRDHPDFKTEHIQWYLRIMDDTYVHTENLALLLRSLPVTDEQIYLGDKWCHDSNHTYLYGGTGMVFNRAVVRDFDDNLWESIPARYPPLNNLDDLCWGAYITNTKAPTRIIHEHGFTHIDSDRLDHDIWNMVTRDHIVPPWPLVAIHLAHNAYTRMEDVHKMIWESYRQLTFKPGVSDAKPAPCECIKGYHSRCLARRQFLDDLECRWVGYRWRCYFAS